MNSKGNTKFLVELALMIAIIIVMALTPLGYIKTPGLSATLFLHMSCSCYLEGLFAPLFLYISHTPHILENPALITTLIHSFSSYYTHSLYIINHPTYFDLYIYTVVPII